MKIVDEPFGNSATLVWGDTRQVRTDETMVFGKGYDFEGMELMREESETAIGRFMIWPDFIGCTARWNVYGGACGYYVSGLASRDAAKIEVENIVRDEIA